LRGGQVRDFNISWPEGSIITGFAVLNMEGPDSMVSVLYISESGFSTGLTFRGSQSGGTLLFAPQYFSFDRSTGITTGIAIVRHRLSWQFPHFYDFPVGISCVDQNGTKLPTFKILEAGQFYGLMNMSTSPAAYGEKIGQCWPVNLLSESRVSAHVIALRFQGYSFAPSSAIQ
jgi:hypothetical protein